MRACARTHACVCVYLNLFTQFHRDRERQKEREKQREREREREEDDDGETDTGRESGRQTDKKITRGGNACLTEESIPTVHVDTCNAIKKT